jgi:anti-sigma B factor antagonist
VTEFRTVGQSGRPSRLTIHTDEQGPWTCVTLVGELDMDNTRDLRDRVDELLADGHVRLEINLRHLTFCDSCGLSALLTAAEFCRRAGGNLTVSEPTGAVKRVMAITGVDTLLCGTPTDPLTRGQYDNRANAAS